MEDTLLTNALAHEFQRCRDTFALFTALHFLILSGNDERNIAIASYNTYSDFISHLYEFYLGCIKRDGRFGRKPLGKAVDTAMNAEVTKLLKLRRDRIIRGDAPSYENHTSHYEVKVPDEFGTMFRSVRNIRSHAIAERSEFDLADFYHKYHRFIILLFDEPQYLWNAEELPEHDWLAIERFAGAITCKDL